MQKILDIKIYDKNPKDQTCVGYDEGNISWNREQITFPFIPAFGRLGIPIGFGSHYNLDYTDCSTINII